MVKLFPWFHRCNNSLMNENIPGKYWTREPIQPGYRKSAGQEGLCNKSNSLCWMLADSFPPADQNTSAILTCLEFTSHWPSTRGNSLIILIPCWVQTSANCLCTCMFLHMEALMPTLAAFRLLNLPWRPECRRFDRRTRIWCFPRPLFVFRCFLPDLTFSRQSKMSAP